jgi:hypothetical protein
LYDSSLMPDEMMIANLAKSGVSGEISEEEVQRLLVCVEAHCS